jgi:hypothetical protein
MELILLFSVLLIASSKSCRVIPGGPTIASAAEPTLLAEELLAVV